MQPEFIHTTEPEKELSSPKRNYFIQHWRGELSLPISYWGNGILGTMIYALFIKITSSFQEIVGLKAIAGALLVVYAAGICLSIWQFMGIWRSASKHTLRGGSKTWAIITKLVVALGILNSVRTTVLHLLPQSIEWVSILSGDNRIPAYEIKILPSGKEMEFNGGLRTGSAREFKQVIATNPQIKVVHINSIGGRMREAAQIADEIRGRNLITYSSEGCMSAATIIFLSGKERIVAGKTKIGFHMSAFRGATAKQNQEMEKRLKEIMSSAGVSNSFIQKVISTPHEEMWYPSVKEMREAGVITGESFGDRFAISGEYLRNSSPEKIDTILRALPGFSAIKEVEPETYSRMIREFSAAIQAGKTEGEAAEIVRRVVDFSVRKYLPDASDEALKAMRDFWVETLEKFKEKDSKTCIMLFSAKTSNTPMNFVRALPGWPIRKESAVLEQIIRSGASKQVRRINSEKAELEINLIAEKLVEKYGDQIELLSDESQWLDHPKVVCDMLFDFYKETQKIPDENQGNVLRCLFSEK